MFGFTRTNRKPGSDYVSWSANHTTPDHRTMCIHGMWSHRPCDECNELALQDDDGCSPAAPTGWCDTVMYDGPDTLV